MTRKNFPGRILDRRKTALHNLVEFQIPKIKVKLSYAVPKDVDHFTAKLESAMKMKSTLESRIASVQNY